MPRLYSEVISRVCSTAATGLVALALREKFPGHANIPVTVDYSLSVPIDNGNASFPSDMLVIDLRQLRRVAP